MLGVRKKAHVRRGGAWGRAWWGKVYWQDGHGVRHAPCVLGWGGVRTHKKEGDGATPAGLLVLREVWWRPDRVTPPRCAVPCRPIGVRDAWGGEGAHYNQHLRCAVHTPLGRGGERLRRVDSRYDLMAVLGYNDDPVEAGAGSAIFLHIAPFFRPTAGCVAMAEPALRQLLATWRLGQMLQVCAHPKRQFQAAGR